MKMQGPVSLNCFEENVFINNFQMNVSLIKERRTFICSIIFEFEMNSFPSI